MSGPSSAQHGEVPEPELSVISPLIKVNDAHTSNAIRTKRTSHPVKMTSTTLPLKKLLFTFNTVYIITVVCCTNSCPIKQMDARDWSRLGYSSTLNRIICGALHHSTVGNPSLLHGTLSTPCNAHECLLLIKKYCKVFSSLLFFIQRNNLNGLPTVTIKPKL